MYGAQAPIIGSCEASGQVRSDYGYKDGAPFHHQASTQFSVVQGFPFPTFALPGSPEEWSTSKTVPFFYQGHGATGSIRVEPKAEILGAGFVLGLTHAFSRHFCSLGSPPSINVQLLLKFCRSCGCGAEAGYCKPVLVFSLCSVI